MLRALNESGETDPFTLLKKYGLGPRPIANYAAIPPAQTGVRGTRVVHVEVHVEEGFEVGTHPLHGKVILITGTIPGMTQDQAREAVRSVGGIPKESKSWSREVNVLVEGVQTNLRPGKECSGKMEKARVAQDNGYDVEIYTHTEFKHLLSLGTDYSG